jgi:hypothetical protein
VNKGGDHVNANIDLDLSSVFSVNSGGESGVVIIMAPFPYYETGESPYAFIAITYT